MSTVTSDPPNPNVLLVVVDSLRYDAVVGDATATPVLDGLRERGIDAARCYSQGSSTAPAMTALFTARHPLDHDGHWYLADAQPTMAEEFRAAGYATGAVHSNPYVSARRNFDKGFEAFREDTVGFEPDRRRARLPDTLRRGLNRLQRVLGRTPYTPAPDLNRTALEVLDAMAEPWFLWVHYMDVHGPYLPGGDPTYRNKLRAERLWRKAAVTAPDAVTDAEHAELLAHYRREVEYVDRHLGRLLGALRDRGALEDTVVVLVADHGEEFGEHGAYGHGNLPYDELVHVPLVVRPPERIAEDRPDRISEPIRGVDLLPTLAAVVDVELSPTMTDRMAGTAVLAVEDGAVTCSPPPVSLAEPIVTEKRVRNTHEIQVGLRTDAWTFLYDERSDGTRLYDRTDDPDERDDVADRTPDVHARFLDRLEERLATIDATASGEGRTDIDVRPEVADRLRALGYRE